MQLNSVCARIVLGLGIALAGTASFAKTNGEAKFYEAYYLEQVQADWAAAAKLYEEVVADRRAPEEMRSQAKARLIACREEIAAGDFARLMPPDVLAYVELNRPGDQITKLLGSLGLIAGPGQVVAEGTKRVAISPALIKELLGIRGVAVAITGIDPRKGEPTGVAVLHPGSVEAIRGLLQTGLPAGGTAVEPIGGYATFDVEGEVLVTLTSRMVIASRDRSLIEGVVARLTGKDKNSLATNPTIAEALGDRSDALLAFFINAKPIMPMVKGMIAAQGGDARELAMIDSILDLDSLQSVSGKIGVGEDGLSLDIALRLDEGHRNLAYNFLRAPAINQQTLKCVPSGVAAFLVGALNDASSSYSGGMGTKPGDPPIVTALDFGREIFANITSVAIFALPPTGDRSAGGMPIPDVAAAITVNDPAKSEALWTTILGVAGMAAGTPIMEGEKTQIAGTSVRTYSLPENMTLYFTTLGNDVVIATTKSAMARTIEAKRKGKSVASDGAFATSLARLNDKSTKGVFVHAGRCAQIARMFIPPGELAEAKPFLDALERTVAAIVIEHSDQVFGISASVSGIPDIGDLVGMQLTMEANKQKKRKQLTKAMKEGRWDDALAEVKSQLAALPGSPKLLRTKFKILAVGIKDVDAARACSRNIYEKIKGNANALNGFAWALVTEDQYQGAYNDIALRFSEKSNEMTDHDNWAYLDTLAWATFKTGDAEAAVKLEKKAIDRSNGRSAKTLQKALAKFEKKSKESKLATTVDPG